jgi:hypothetical protein
MSIKLQNNQPYNCCAVSENHEPIFVFVNGFLGFTQFCTKCGYVFLSETQFPAYETGNKKGEPVNVFEDIKSVSPTINILRNKVKYIVFPEGKADKSLIEMLGVTELKLK